jgi:hypothetical protein
MQDVGSGVPRESTSQRSSIMCILTGILLAASGFGNLNVAAKAVDTFACAAVVYDL